MLWEASRLSDIYTEAEKIDFCTSISTISNQIRAFCDTLYSRPHRPTVKEELFSPFVPYSIYQAAVVHHNLWKQTHLMVYHTGFETLRSSLQRTGKRWLIARIYMQRLDTLENDSVSLLSFLYKERALSSRGPTGDPARPYAA